jgi:hypothetical protein
MRTIVDCGKIVYGYAARVGLCGALMVASTWQPMYHYTIRNKHRVSTLNFNAVPTGELPERW